MINVNYLVLHFSKTILIMINHSESIRSKENRAYYDEKNEGLVRILGMKTNLQIFGFL